MMGDLWGTAVAYSVLLLLSSVLHTNGYPTQAEETHDEQAQDLLDRFWQWRLRESPEYGTKIGIHDYDHLVEEFTEEAFNRQKVSAEGFMLEVTGLLDTSDISRATRINLLVLQHNLLAFCEGYEYRSYGMYNPIGVIREWVQQIYFMPKETESDYNNILERYKALPKQIDDQIVLMKKSIAVGHTFHISTLETGDDLAFLKQEAETRPEESVFYVRPFRSIPFTLPQQTRRDLLMKGYETVKQFVVPTWAKLYHFLTTEYKNHTRPGIGASSMPGGEAYYEAALRWHTTTDLTAAEVFHLGIREVDRVSKLMEDVVRQTGFNGTVKDYIAFLKADSRNFFKTKRAMLRQYQTIMNQVHRKLKRVLKFVPSTNVTLMGISNPSSALGYYVDPPLDGSRPGYFYANLHQPESKAKFEMLPVTLHEAEPGHHTQCAYAIDMNLPPFRQAIEYRKFYAPPFNWPYMTAAIEGWALYAETLHDEMRVTRGDPLTMIGLYSSEIFRAARLVVDTGIHVMGWTETQAKEYISNHTTYSEQFIDAEVRRYIKSPAQACAYKIGQLTLKELRFEAEMELGDSFDLKEYHHQLLSLGPAPLGIIKDVIRQWIKDELEKMVMENGSGESFTVDMETDIMVIPMPDMVVYNESKTQIIELTEVDLMMNETASMLNGFYEKQRATENYEFDDVSKQGFGEDDYITDSDVVFVPDSVTGIFDVSDLIEDHGRNIDLADATSLASIMDYHYSTHSTLNIQPTETFENVGQPSAQPEEDLIKSLETITNISPGEVPPLSVTERTTQDSLTLPETASSIQGIYNTANSSQTDYVLTSEEESHVQDTSTATDMHEDRDVPGTESEPLSGVLSSPKPVSFTDATSVDKYDSVITTSSTPVKSHVNIADETTKKVTTNIMNSTSWEEQSGPPTTVVDETYTGSSEITTKNNNVTSFDGGTQTVGEQAPYAGTDQREKDKIIVTSDDVSAVTGRDDPNTAAAAGGTAYVSMPSACLVTFNIILVCVYQKLLSSMCV